MRGTSSCQLGLPFPTTRHLELGQHVLLLGRRHTPAADIRGQAAPASVPGSARIPALVFVVLAAAARQPALTAAAGPASSVNEHMCGFLV